MSTGFRLLMVLVLASTALSGCFGDDDAPSAKATDDQAADPEVTAETGSITGKVLTKDLEVVASASVAAIAADGALAADTKTDAEGEFTMNGLPAGEYRVQVSSVLHKAAVRAVTVTANEVARADIQVERLTADDLATPYMTTEEWEGFMSCGVGTRAITYAACAQADGTAAEDPNMDFLHYFNVSKGLKTIIVGVTWAPAGGVFGTDLWINVEVPGCGLSCPSSRTYAQANSGPDIVMRIDEGPQPELFFDNVTEEGREIQMRVFPGGSYNVMYQQPFKVYWHEFFHEEAPEDFIPFPDA